MSGEDSAAQISGSEISTEDTMRARADESRLKLWLLIGAGRFRVLAVLASAVFVLFIAAAYVLNPSLSVKLQTQDTVETLFTTMISVLVTGTTLVVTIGQIILSQENGPLGDQRNRMSDAIDFRDFTTELIGRTASAEPAVFIREIVEESSRRGEAVRRIVGESDDEELNEQVGEFVDSLQGNADTVTDRLEDAEFGAFDVLSASLDFNYSWKVYQARRLRNQFSSSLDNDQRTALEQLETALTMFGPAREHVKTLYFQWALVDLSRYILYAAVPAVAVAGIMATFVTSSTFPGATLGLSNVTWVVAVAFTISVVPFLLFTSYIMRITVVAKRTLAIDPLILRDSQR